MKDAGNREIMPVFPPIADFIPKMPAYHPVFDQKRYIKCSTNIESYSVIRSMEHNEPVFGNCRLLFTPCALD